MTQPPSPGDMAIVDQAHADASRFIDQMLTTGVTELQSGRPVHELFVSLGGGLCLTENVNGPMGPAQYRVLVAAAVSRLAQMHHAVEQLADTLADDQPTAVPTDEGYCEAMAYASSQVRRLVDDHG